MIRTLIVMLVLAATPVAQQVFVAPTGDDAGAADAGVTDAGVDAGATDDAGAGSDAGPRQAERVAREGERAARVAARVDG